jgi:hypothetical protein
MQPAHARVERADLLLDFAAGALFTLRRAQRWRFWRKPFAISQE